MGPNPTAMVTVRGSLRRGEQVAAAQQQTAMVQQQLEESLLNEIENGVTVIPELFLIPLICGWSSVGSGSADQGGGGGAIHYSFHTCVHHSTESLCTVLVMHTHTHMRAHTHNHITCKRMMHAHERTINRATSNASQQLYGCLFPPDVCQRG